jgi:hypothetical protein
MRRTLKIELPPWGCSLAVKAVACRAKDRGFKSHHPRGALSAKSHSDSHSECATFVKALEWKDKRRAKDHVLSSMRSGLSFQVVQDAKWFGVALQKQFSRVSPIGDATRTILSLDSSAVSPNGKELGS